MRWRRPAVILMTAWFLSACGAHVHHRVKPGETLYAIGWRYGVDYRDLARWNGIDSPYLIRPGQVLRVAPPRVPWWAQEAQSRARPQTPSPIAVESPSRPSPPPRQAAPSVKAAPSIPAKRDQTPIRWRWPVNGPVVRRFDLTPPANKGIDIAGSLGSPVRAAAGGVVVYTGQGIIGYDNLIIVKHDQNYLSAYAHNQTLLVREKDRVTAGQIIARMGRDDTGRTVVHFEIRYRGRPIDPLKLLPRRGGDGGG